MEPRSTYLEYGGISTVPGPFQCSDGVIYMFGLRAEEGRLQALCDTVLADPQGKMRYRALGPYILLTFGKLTVRSQNGTYSKFFGIDYKEMGASPEKHASLWVFTEALHRGRVVEWIDRLAIFIPAMWVDNPISLVGGREIYGIAKQWGNPIVGDGDKPAFSLDVYGGNFGVDATTSVQRLFDLTPGPRLKSLGAFRSAVSELEENPKWALRGEARKLAIPDASFFHALWKELVGHQLSQVCLRQFRTPGGDGLQSSARELVEVASHFSRFTPQPLLRSFRFDLRDLDSHPLQRTLGLESQDVAFGWRIDAEFTLEVV